MLVKYKINLTVRSGQSLTSNGSEFLELLLLTILHRARAKLEYRHMTSVSCDIRDFALAADLSERADAILCLICAISAENKRIIHNKHSQVLVLSFVIFNRTKTEIHSFIFTTSNVVITNHIISHAQILPGGS